MSHTAPICKSLGHLDIFWRYMGKESGRTTNVRPKWMDEPKERPKRQTNTYYPPDSVIVVPDRVNGVRKSWANEVIDQWRSKMIKPLVDIIISRHTQMKR